MKLQALSSNTDWGLSVGARDTACLANTSPPGTTEAIRSPPFKNAPAFAEKIPGHLMLTDHADECTFRNLRIRELK